MNLLQSARKYLELGFSVIPVKITWNKVDKKFEKKPAPWKEYQTRQATEEELNEWFASGRYNGIGIVTGRVSGVYVVDVDKGNVEGDITTLGLESGRVSKTISGGKHFFYRIDGKDRVILKNATRINGLNVDIRGEGGFVVAPPTKIEKDGKVFKYEWEKGNDLQTMYLKTTPDAVLKAVNVKKNSSEGWQEVESKKLDISECINVEKGGRNDHLYRLACSLLSKHGTDEAWQLVQSINQSYNPPLPTHEIKTLFGSAFRFVDGKAKKEEDVDTFLMGTPIRWDKIEAPKLDTQWIWENYIARGNITLLTAIMKSGKSTFLRCLLTSLNDKVDFAGQPVTKTNVLVISEESGDKWVEARENLEKELGHVHVWVRPTRGKPNQKKWEEVVKTISQKCIELDVGLVVIDTLSSFWPIDNENDSAQVVRALLPLYNFTEANMGVLLIHHDRKGGGQFGEASRGSNALTAFVDNIVHFVRNPDGTPNQRVLKTWGRFDNVVPQVVVEYTNEGDYVLRGEPWKVSHTARVTKLLEMITKANEPLTVKHLHSMWVSTIGDINMRQIHRLKKELLEKGQIKKCKEEIHGKKKTPYFTSTGWEEIK